MATNKITFETFKKYWEECGLNNKEIENLWEHPNKTKLFETDTNKDKVGVSEQLIRQGKDDAHLPKNWQVINSRLYQFGTKPNAKNQVIFGTIFEIGYEKESDDLIIIRKMLERELNSYEKAKVNEEDQGRLVLNKAIENIKDTEIYKIEPLTIYSEEQNKNITRIYKHKLCGAKELLECQEI